ETLMGVIGEDSVERRVQVFIGLWVFIGLLYWGMRMLRVSSRAQDLLKLGYKTEYSATFKSLDMNPSRQWYRQRHAALHLMTTAGEPIMLRVLNGYFLKQVETLNLREGDLIAYSLFPGFGLGKFMFS